jgi:hypothetical protein
MMGNRVKQGLESMNSQLFAKINTIWRVRMYRDTQGSAGHFNIYPFLHTGRKNVPVREPLTQELFKRYLSWGTDQWSSTHLTVLVFPKIGTNIPNKCLFRSKNESSEVLRFTCSIVL